MSKPARTSLSAESAAVLLREDKDGVATLTLNRPEARNALSEALLAALIGEFDAIAKDRSVRAVIVAGNGPVFCAGHDTRAGWHAERTVAADQTAAGI